MRQDENHGRASPMKSETDPFSWRAGSHGRSRQITPDWKMAGLLAQVQFLSQTCENHSQLAFCMLICYLLYISIVISEQVILVFFSLVYQNSFLSVYPLPAVCYNYFASLQIFFPLCPVPFQFVVFFTVQNVLFLYNHICRSFSTSF